MINKITWSKRVVKYLCTLSTKGGSNPLPLNWSQKGQNDNSKQLLIILCKYWTKKGLECLKMPILEPKKCKNTFFLLLIIARKHLGYLENLVLLVQMLQLYSYGFTKSYITCTNTCCMLQL